MEGGLKYFQHWRAASATDWIRRKVLFSNPSCMDKPNPEIDISEMLSFQLTCSEFVHEPRIRPFVNCLHDCPSEVRPDSQPPVNVGTTHDGRSNLVRHLDKNQTRLMPNVLFGASPTRTLDSVKRKIAYYCIDENHPDHWTWPRWPILH